MWSEIEKWLVVDQPSPSQRFLGVNQHYFEEPVKNLAFILDLHPRVRGREALPQKYKPQDPEWVVRGYRYEMTDFFNKAVDKFCALGNIDRKSLKKVATPFVDESQDPAGYVESDNPADDKARGQLANGACSVIMTNMFGCRVCRFDLLRGTANLATFVHKWTPNTDKKLLRLMSYINGRADDSAIGFIGDPLKDCYLALFADADFAGCKDSLKSTGGVFLVLMGPHVYATDGTVKEAYIGFEFEYRGRACYSGPRDSDDWHSGLGPL